MADFSENDMSRMRLDAIKRMQDMQRRAQRAQQQEGSDAPKPSPPPRSGDLGSLLGTILKPPGGGHGGNTFNIGGIAIDEEKAMIAMLIYILYKQGSDVRLLLALGYLLL